MNNVPRIKSTTPCIKIIVHNQYVNDRRVSELHRTDSSAEPSIGRVVAAIDAGDKTSATTISYTSTTISITASDVTYVWPCTWIKT